MRTGRMWFALAGVILLACGTSVAFSGSVSPSIPATPDPAALYLFYLHGRVVEEKGDNAFAKKYGRYAYDDILDAFAKRGFTVIGEVRPPGRPLEYARKVADQVKQLITAGVPAANITVGGHSRGGLIAMHVAALLRNPEINYVILAACISTRGRGVAYHHFVADGAKEMLGRMLVAWDDVDDVAGSCGDALEKAPAQKSEERILKTGQGHTLFYTPQAVWLDLVEAWAKRK